MLIKNKSMYELAYSYYQKQDFETAIKFFEKVVNKDDSSENDIADSYVMLGVCNMFLAEKCITDEIKYELRAIEYYTKVIDCYPKHIDEAILTDLALAYGDIKDYDNAILAYEKVIKFDEENADAYFQLAGLYDIQGDSNKALSYALKAIEIFDQSWNYYFHLSLIYRDLSNFEESINILKKAIDLKPDYFEAYCNMADAYNHLGKFDLAIEFATKAVDINPTDVCSICTLAESYEHKKELSIAKNLYDMALKLDPNFKEVIDGLKRVEENVK
jgi:tetratricopeptide (TPR) repeat protein